MSNPKEHERTALEAVARRFSARLEKDGNLPHARIIVAGKRIAVHIAKLKQRCTAHGKAAKPRLRFDKVVIGLMEHLQVTLGKAVPDRTTVLLTVTAPIRLPSKTAVALKAKIQILLDRRSPPRDAKGTIHGNRVRIRLLRHEAERAPKMIGFVHNPDSDWLLLLDMTRDLLELIFKAQASRATKPAGEHWLVVITAEGTSHLQAYLYICSQLRASTKFKKILMVAGVDRVEVLAG